MRETMQAIPISSSELLMKDVQNVIWRSGKLLHIFKERNTGKKLTQKV
jgi:hypothetical protein